MPRKRKFTKLDLIMSISRSCHVLQRYLQVELAKYNTNQVRFEVMTALILHNGRLTPGRISQLVYRTPHTISSMLKALQKDGLIRKELNNEDHRSIEIVVTDHGWKSIGKMKSAGEDFSEKAFSCLTDEQTKELRETFFQLRKNLLQYIR